MPMIDLTYVRGSLNDQALGRLTDELNSSRLTCTPRCAPRRVSSQQVHGHCMFGR